MSSNVFDIDQIVDIEYPQGICSPIYVVEKFSGLFAHPSTFLIKDSITAYINTYMKSYID